VRQPFDFFYDFSRCHACRLVGETFRGKHQAYWCSREFLNASRTQ
jgi:hypothetical protein